jgi:chromosome segregation ATPase
MEDNKVHGQCETCNQHKIVEYEIDGVKKMITSMENNIKSEITKLDNQHECDMELIDKKFKEFKEQDEKKFDLILSDIKKLFEDNYKMKETITEIKNTIQRASDNTAHHMEKIKDEITRLLEEKKENKTEQKDKKLYIFYPLIVGVLLAIVGYLAGHFFK